MSKYNEFKKYYKFYGGFGLTSILGFVSYESYKTYRALSTLINSNVLDIDKKRPDYIYIKHHIYRHSLQKRLKEQEGKRLLDILFQPFGKWWKTMKHSIAWRLLRMAQQGDQNERLKAVRQLALIDHLKDWDFQHLAQLCDSQTAISLARLNCDQRWFLPPKQYGVQKTPRDVLSDVKNLLEKLLPNKCVEYALEHTFSSYQIKEPEGDAVSYGVALSRHENDMMRQCMDVLLHITTNDEICEKIVQAGGLLTLVEIEKLYQNNIEMKLFLSRILANISVCSQLVYDFFATGWISILVRWQRDIDMRVQVTSSLALSNLDKDDPNSFMYAPKIYPLHPRSRKKNKPDMDVIFIHGLLGGVFVTWRQKDLKPEGASLLGKKSTMTVARSSAKPSQPATTTNPKQRDQQQFDKNFQNSFYEEEGLTMNKDEIIQMKNSPPKTKPNISDNATKEIIKALQEEEELSSDWTVVFPDIPIIADETNCGPYSVSGDRWVNGIEKDDFTFCWPMEWLPKDFPNIRVVGINYESSLSQWSASGCPCEKYNGKLDKRAAEFLDRLVKAKVGQDRPVIWVGHSMGGLLVKSIIVQALQSEDENVRQIGLNSRGVMFLGTPHRGSTIAKLKHHTSALFWPSVEVKELEENSKALLKLNEDFLNKISLCKNKLEIVSICEGAPTILTSFKFPLFIVSENSARLNAGDFYLTNDDHLGISKPICRQSFLYQRLVRIIDDTMSTSKNSEQTGDYSNPRFVKYSWHNFRWSKEFEKLFNIIG